MMRIEFEAIRIPSYDPDNSFQIMATGTYLLPTNPGDNMTTTLRPVWGSAADWYKVDYSIGEPMPQHWQQLTVCLTINTVILGIKPGIMYVGEPTDIPTEILRFEEITGPPIPGKMNQYLDAGVWMLTMRRSH